jgi:hypothetical protein
MTSSDILDLTSPRFYLVLGLGWGFGPGAPLIFLGVGGALGLSLFAIIDSL